MSAPRAPPARPSRPARPQHFSTGGVLARQASRAKRRTIETYQSVARLHILAHFGEATPLTSITRSTVRDWLLGRLAEGYGADSVRHMLAILRTVMNSARFEDQLIKENVCDRLTRILPARHEPATEKVLRPDEVQRLLAALHELHPPIHVAVVLALCAGLRIGELLGLVWTDVSLDESYLMVRRSRDGRGRMDTPKGKRAVRLPLSPQAVAALRALKPTTRVTAEGWVFPSLYGPGNPWSRTHFRRILQRACGTAHVREISAHVLRHSFITGLASTGQDPWMVQQLARHRSIQTTMGYVHLARTGPQQTAAIAAVEHYLMPRPTPPTPDAGA